MTTPSDKAFANGKHDLKRGIDFVGVTCSFLCHDGKGNILMHRRSQNCRDEQGKWDCGGGALEHGEQLEAATVREIKEEYGADATELTFIGYHDVHRRLDDGTPTHWVCIMFAAKVDPKQVRNNEPHKIDEIGWFTMGTLPGPLHSQVMKGITAGQRAGVI